MAATKRRARKSQETCPCEGNSLDRLIRPAVLAALAEESLHGYALVHRLGEMPPFKGQEPDLSGVYRVLNWLEKRGYIVSAWNTSGSGPARKTYRLAPPGRRCLRTWVQTLDNYARAVEELRKVAHHAADRPGR